MLDARSRGAAILWISHDIEEDARHADFVFTLKDRSLVMSAGGASC
jgi:ABC-type iron transport system FetAB ATPase subunit